MKRRFWRCFLFLAAALLMIPSAPASGTDGMRSGKDIDDYKTFTVTFNPGKGTVDRTSKTVIVGEPYGTLPVPVWNAHEFSGWYTEDAGSRWITSTTIVELNRNQTLYARWVSAPVPRRVKFDPNGGTVTPDSKQVIPGGIYGDLPIPSNGKLAFEGWYTDREKGKQVTRTTTVSDPMPETLYARWSQSSVVSGACTVTFDGSGASVDPAFIVVPYGTAYGDLPYPEKKGYVFQGWFTDSVKGERILSQDKAPETPRLTLYAHWEKLESLVSINDLTYNFRNTREDFGYDANYKIDYSRYALIFGDGPAAQTYYEADGLWGGNCYGMSVTAAMLYQASSGISTNTFEGGGGKPSDLDVNAAAVAAGWDGITLRSFIEAMQISQKSFGIQNNLNDNKNKPVADQLRLVCNAVTSFQTTGNNPVVIALARKKSGHAVLGYQLIDINNSESRLLVYDCNYPREGRYITLYKDASGNYTEWYYPMNNQEDWGSRFEGSWISYVTYSEACVPWTIKGNANANLKEELLTVNSSNISIEDSSGNSVATVLNGDLRTERSDIFPMLQMTGSNDSENRVFSVWLPIGKYTIRNHDAGIREMEATMVHCDQSCTVKTNASALTCLVSDTARSNFVILEEPGKTYEITLHSNLRSAKKAVTLKGVTSADTSPTNVLAFAQSDGKLCSDGVALGSSVSLTVDGQAGSAVDLTGSAISAMTAILTPPQFTDVPEKYLEAVNWAVRTGVASGYTSTTFGPNDSCSRAQFITFLWRAHGSQEPTGPNQFTDVPAGSYYEKAARWARGKKLMEGNQFNGSAPCSQAEALTFLWKLKGCPRMDQSPSRFSHISLATEYGQAISWADINGLAKEIIDPSTFSLDTICTRGQAVLFLYRYFS